MVQSVNPGKIRPESESGSLSKVPVKLEIEDSLDEEHGPINKRSKLSTGPFHQQWSTVPSTLPSQPTNYNPLDEPSPLGLRLRKSPSLLDLIQMRLSQGNAENVNLGKKDIKSTPISATTDKLKASNFPASLLRIGTWEYVSRHEGDLVAKCYFAKHKLVWEVLDGGLKSKIEIQWSDITALKANCPEDGPGILDIVLARQPLFFRETNPQPRKHTLWQATSDFTHGQASMHRRHFLQSPQGLLSKQFEKLIQCDHRLNQLSQQPEITLESPYFESRGCAFDGQDESKFHAFEPLTSNHVPPFSGFQDAEASCGTLSSTSKSELWDPVGTAQDHGSREITSPSSVMDSRIIEENTSSETEGLKERGHQDQFKVPMLGQSMSMSDLLSHIGHCISEQMTSGNPLFGKESEGREVLDQITQCLLSDSQIPSCADEKLLMSRVNSLCCLLQKDAPKTQNLQVGNEGDHGCVNGSENQPKFTLGFTCDDKNLPNFPAPEMKDNNDVMGSNQLPAMSRKESLGDLLLHLPRIASLPQFLFNISEHGE